jgi:hypothetical protein
MSNNNKVSCICGDKYTGERCEVKNDTKIEGCNSSQTIPPV